MDKFSYFDFIAHVVPGGLLLGMLSLLLGSTRFILISGNATVDTLLFVILSFVIGAFLHQLSNHSVEPIVKRLFWHGRLYSEVYLVKQYGLCQDPMRAQILDVASSLFGFDPESLSALNANLSTKGTVDPHVVSHQVYRRFDYFTSDNNLAKKGHTANTLYSLYRTMTLTAFILAILFAISYRWSSSAISPESKIVLAVLCLVALVLFLLRTRSQGQRYVQGVLYAVVKK